MFNEMKRSIHFLEYLYCHLLIVFLIGRVGFVLNNRCVEQLSFLDAMSACWRGFVGHDLMVAAWLLVVPWLVAIVQTYSPLPRLLPRGGGEKESLPPRGEDGGGLLRTWLTPYYLLMGLAVAAIIVADAVMYEFWQFKLGMVVLSYAASPEGATNSVSLSYIIIRVAAFLLLALWTIVPCISLTPKTLPTGRTERLWMRNISIIWIFLLVSGGLWMRLGDVYTSKPHPTQLADHAAVNSV